MSRSKAVSLCLFGCFCSFIVGYYVRYAVVAMDPGSIIRSPQIIDKADFAIEGESSRLAFHIADGKCLSLIADALANRRIDASGGTYVYFRTLDIIDSAGSANRVLVFGWKHCRIGDRLYEVDLACLRAHLSRIVRNSKWFLAELDPM